MKLLVEIEGHLSDKSPVLSEIHKQLESVYFAPTKTYLLLNINSEVEYKKTLWCLTNRIKNDNNLSLISIHPIYENEWKI